MIDRNTKQIDFDELSRSLAAVDSFEDLKMTIVNHPFSNQYLTAHFALGIIVLLIRNDTSATLDRVAISNTEMAHGAMNISTVPFRDIKIPLDYEDNILVKALTTQKMQITDDWSEMFSPVLSPVEAQLNQSGAGVGSSAIQPLVSPTTNRSFGALIFSYYEPAYHIGREHAAFMRKYAEIVMDRITSLR